MTPLLIVGGSGRAAAASAIRRGYEPWVIDLFADTDTQAMATTIRCENYPDGFVALANQVPPMEWMYTGGLENYPDIVDAISERHRLIGNGGQVLNQVRHPWSVATMATIAGCRMPDTLHGAVTILAPGRWLCKSFHGAGGIGVREFEPGVDTADTYVQQFVNGTPLSAAFEGGRLIGISEQLCGTTWLHATGFQYAGNLRRDDAPHRSTFQRLGDVFSRWYQLVGPWGIDAIEEGDSILVLEVNPRYTASMELFENGLPAKAIYYAPQQITFPGVEGDRFADIPNLGTVIEAGQPVLTFFGDDLLQLNAVARELDHHFGVTP